MSRPDTEEELFPRDGEWDKLYHLCTQIDRGDEVFVDVNLTAHIARVAKQVAIPADQIEAAKRSDTAILALAKESQRRIREGSWRLGTAIIDAYKAMDAGQPERARELLSEIIREEVVPWYRENARRQLGHLKLSPDE